MTTNSRNELLDAALAYHKAGISVLPARSDKKPKLNAWAAYQDRLPTERELHTWFNGTPYGMSALNGKVSRNTETLDIDNKRPGDAVQSRAAFVDLVEADAPGLIERLAEQTTPSGGFHFKYRTDTVRGNHKLAQRPASDEEKQVDPDAKAITLIETRGEGGYALVEPSPGYHVIRGDFANPPYITAEEQSILHAAAAALNTYCKPSDTVSAPRAVKQASVATDGVQPGTDFNERGDVETLLTSTGWVKVRTRGEGSDWRRPGKKDGGISATLDIVAPGVFYVFSSNASPFDNERGYDRFAVYTLLNHDGDYQAAVGALAQEGYGTSPEPGRDAHGYALCPNCNRRLDPDKSGKGYHCPKEGDSLCFWWKGEGYVYPGGRGMYGLNYGTRQTTADVRDTGEAPVRKLLHVSQLSTLAPPEEIISGVISRNKLSLIYGMPGAGKSLVNTDIALTVSQYATVVYLAGEDIEEYLARVQAWSEYHNAEPGSLYFWPEPVNLLNPESVAAFLAEVAPLNPALIVVDTLATCMTGADENSTKEMGIAIESLHYIRRQTQAGLLICHHTGWSDTHERGSSALRGAVRTAIKVSQNDDGLISVTCEKSNNAAKFEPRYFRMVPKADSVTLIPSSKLTGRDAPLKQKHYDLMEALSLPIFTDGASFTQLVEHTGMAKSTVNFMLSKLLERDYVDCTSGRNKVYSLSVTGKAELQSYFFNTAGASSVVQGSSSGFTEQLLNWTVALPKAQEPSSAQVQPSSAQVQGSIPDSPEFSSVPPLYKGGTLNTGPVEQDPEHKVVVSEKDKDLADQVQQAIDEGNVPKAKELAHKIDNRALWNAMFDKIDQAKAVSA